MADRNRPIRAFTAGRASGVTVLAWVDDDAVQVLSAEDTLPPAVQTIAFASETSAVAVTIDVRGDLYVALREASGVFPVVRVPYQGGKF